MGSLALAGLLATGCDKDDIPPAEDSSDEAGEGGAPGGGSSGKPGPGSSGKEDGPGKGGDASGKGKGSGGGGKGGKDSSGKDSPGGGDKDDAGDGSNEGTPAPDDGPRLGDLPVQVWEPITHDVFTAAYDCSECHTSARGVLENSSKESVAPNDLWESSLMALSGRDPYWIAQFSHELQVNPEHEDAVSDRCTRCHAPVANEAMRRSNQKISFDTIIKDTSDIGELGREGVTCTLCHQISTEGQSGPDHFGGNFVIGNGREIWGPHSDPLTYPMRTTVNYNVKASDHVLKSEHCASCHTVLTKPLGGSKDRQADVFPEQVPFLEWKNSDFPGQGKSCQSCHMPRKGRDGHDFTTILSTQPGNLRTKREVGDHGFVGANAYMLELMADAWQWTGVVVDRESLLEAAANSLKFLQTTVSLELKAGYRPGKSVVTSLINHAGHKFPTAYPTRRAWLEVEAFDAKGKTVFHSGAFNKRGKIKKARLPMPHHSEITKESQVQIYEGVMADADNKPTHTLTKGSQWWKDNRLLPQGWSDSHEDAKWTKPVGTSKDKDFRAGQDDTTYVLPDSATKVTVKLWFQTVPPESVDAMSRKPTPATRKFRDFTQKHPTLPKLVTSAELKL